MISSKFITSINEIKKVELHVHIEGTLSLERYSYLSVKNSLNIDEANMVIGLRLNQSFNNLAEFLKIYYLSMHALVTEDDFFLLTYDHLEKAHLQNIIYTEIFFDPQAHMLRGIPFETVISGITRAMNFAKSNLGIVSQLVMCALRDRSQSEAILILEKSVPYKNEIIGVGLDSDENGNPPWKFNDFFVKARNMGYFLTCHCDVNQFDSLNHIRYCVNSLCVDRIDHGLNCLEDDRLVDNIADQGIGLTICPVSNFYVAGSLTSIEIRRLVERGVKVTINSDDPEFFSADLIDNCNKLIDSQELSLNDIKLCMKHAAEICWMPIDYRNSLIGSMM